MTRTVLVVGSSGFVGAHLVADFAAAGWNVLAGVRNPAAATRLDLLAPSVRRIPLDLTSRAAIASSLRSLDVDTVVNCAAYGVNYSDQDTETAISVNITLAVRLVEAAADAGVARFIHVGTAYEYGGHAAPIDESHPLAPRGLYGSTKAAGSVMALSRGGTLGLPVTVLRLFTMFGPLESEDKFTPSVIARLRNGEPVDLTAGEQIRDFLYVRDATNACVAVASSETPFAGTVFNVGSGASVTLRTYGMAVAQAIGSGDGLLRWGGRPYRADEVMFLVAHTQRLRSAVGWAPMTPLQLGLQQTVRYRQASGALGQ